MICTLAFLFVAVGIVCNHAAASTPSPLSLCGWLDAASYDPWTDFDWDIVDGDGEGGTCGGSKCFFPQSNATGHGKDVGWIIQQSGAHNISHAWELAQHLHAQFGLCHLMLGAPQRRTLTQDQAAQLSSHLFWQGFKVRARYASGGVDVQPVRPCPP